MLNWFRLSSYKILNVIINSKQFDSVYTSEKVVFVSNEMLSIDDSCIVIRKRNVNIEIRSSDALKNEQYIWLGDINLQPPWEPKAVFVQLEIFPQNVLLDLRLEIMDSVWKVTEYYIDYNHNKISE